MLWTGRNYPNRLSDSSEVSCFLLLIVASASKYSYLRHATATHTETQVFLCKVYVCMRLHLYKHGFHYRGRETRTEPEMSMYKTLFFTESITPREASGPVPPPFTQLDICPSFHH